MPRARKHLVCVDDTPYYHVTSRCVRRAFLCGIDKLSGQNYEHRRSWVEDRIRILSSLFSIDVCAYAVMSNHYHLVVRLDPGVPATWSNDDVLRRWTTLFRGPLLVQRYRAGETLEDGERDTLQSIVAVYRRRLGCLSWFMKCLNEPIARRANAEDRCSGHFWEARFHSQALLSEQALIAAMVYTDLNPVRAGIARSPESAKFTSIRARLEEDAVQSLLYRSIAAYVDAGEIRGRPVPIRPLMAFAATGNRNDARRDCSNIELPITESDYLQLVDDTGRISSPGKRGRIPDDLKPVLERLGLDTEEWPTLRHSLTRYLRKAAPTRKKSA